MPSLTTANRAPPPLDPAKAALFLDLDGTLAEIAPRPGDVGPVERRTQLLRRLVRGMDGRVAVLTGRPLDEADRILGGAVAAVAAVHGLVRRAPDGTVISFRPSADLHRARCKLEAVAQAHPGLLVEDKGFSIALHYRQAPEAEELVRRTAEQLAGATDLILQNGAMVSELRTAGPHKGDSLKSLLAIEPFAGRRPVMIGDDLTDEDAFAAAEEMGGYGVLVGAPRETRARYGLAGVTDVLEWLESGAPV